MCLFSLYYTGCLQPSCVVCPQLHSHLNLVGSLPWARGYPLPDPPQSPPHIHTQPDTPTLVSLTGCQVCSVCVCLCVSGGRIEWVLILGIETREFFFFFFLNWPFSKLARRQDQLPHCHKEPGYAGHSAFARHSTASFLNEHTASPPTQAWLFV